MSARPRAQLVTRGAAGRARPARAGCPSSPCNAPTCGRPHSHPPFVPRHAHASPPVIHRDGRWIHMVAALSIHREVVVRCSHDLQRLRSDLLRRGPLRRFRGAGRRRPRLPAGAVHDDLLPQRRRSPGSRLLVHQGGQLPDGHDRFDPSPRGRARSTPAPATCVIRAADRAKIHRRIQRAMNAGRQVSRTTVDQRFLPNTADTTP